MLTHSTLSLRFKTPVRAALLLAALLGLLLPRPALAAEPTASVALGPLNFRAGPGLDARVLRLLDEGQALTLLGRSADSAWLNVRLPNGSAGWVYAAYVKTEAATIAALPVTQAAGGPVSQPTAPATGYRLSMTIADNQATVTVQRYPANAALTVTLSRDDGSGRTVVAQGQTDALGAAQFAFAMPRQWADGQPVRESALTLAASTDDGRFTRTVGVQYIR